MIAALRNGFLLYPKRAASIPVRIRHPGRFRVIDHVAADGRTSLSYLSLWDLVQEHLERISAEGIFNLAAPAGAKWAQLQLPHPRIPHLDERVIANELTEVASGVVSG